MKLSYVIVDIIKWTNDNSGFLSLILFIATILAGWITGFFESVIQKPRLKIRFIEKSTFYCFFETGNTYYNAETQETFKLHQTGFAVYMSIANVGNKVTSIDKIFLGYYKNTTKRYVSKKSIVWLPQLHTLDHFSFEVNDKTLLIPPLRGKSEFFMSKEDDDLLEVGKSKIGLAYFEQEEAWGNLNPRAIDREGSIYIILRVRDIYNKNHDFKTVLKPKNLEEAKSINPSFGEVIKAFN